MTDKTRVDCKLATRRIFIEVVVPTRMNVHILLMIFLLFKNKKGERLKRDILPGQMAISGTYLDS